MGRPRPADPIGAGASYTHSDIDARLDHDAVPYIDTSAETSKIDLDGSDRTLEDDRQDVGTHVEVTHAIDPSTLLAASVAYDRNQGYLANPYRVFQVAFIDPAQQFLAPPGGYFAQVRALLEQVPGTRHRLNASLRVNRFLEATARRAPARLPLLRATTGGSSRTPSRRGSRSRSPTSS